MRRSLTFHRTVDLSAEARPPAPFIVGVTRSGTTLLRLMLDAHPKLTIPPETHFVLTVIRKAQEDGVTARAVHRKIAGSRRWGDFDLDADELLRRLERLRPLDETSALRCFYDFYAESKGKPRWGDKTPRYQVKMRRIGRALPEARFIHLIRDGRDVALSQWSKASTPTPVEEAAKRWQQRVRLSRKLGAKQPDRYSEVRYERLVQDPENELRRICEFISLDFDPAVLRFHEGSKDRLDEIAKDISTRHGVPVLDAATRMSAHGMAAQPLSEKRVGVWQREMSPEDVAAFEAVAGETLAELGYPLAGSASESPMHLSAPKAPG